MFRISFHHVDENARNRLWRLSSGGVHRVAEETLHRVTASRPRGRSPFKPWPAEVRVRKKKKKINRGGDRDVPRTRRKKFWMCWVWLGEVSLFPNTFVSVFFFFFTLFPHQTSHKPWWRGSKVTSFLKNDAKFTLMSPKSVYNPLRERPQTSSSPVFHPVHSHCVLFRRSFLRQEDGEAPVEVRRRHFPLPQPGTLRPVDPRPRRAAVITQ